MTTPDAAIEAAAEAIAVYPGSRVGPPDSVLFARAALEAAMPAIREALAQEIEADATTARGRAWLGYAARIVRGGTP